MPNKGELHIMNKLDKLKKLADVFARTWCYDWRSGYSLIEGEAVYIKKAVDPDSFNVRTCVWALDMQSAELECTEEVYQLTEEDLRSNKQPMELYSDAPGEFVDAVQYRVSSLFTENGSDLDGVPEEVLSKAVEKYYEEKDSVSDYFTEDDPFKFVLPVGLNATVRAVLQRLCRKAARKLKAEAAKKAKTKTATT